MTKYDQTRKVTLVKKMCKNCFHLEADGNCQYPCPNKLIYGEHSNWKPKKGFITEGYVGVVTKI